MIDIIIVQTSCATTIGRMLNIELFAVRTHLVHRGTVPLCTHAQGDCPPVHSSGVTIEEMI